MTKLVDVMQRLAEPFPPHSIEWKPGVMMKDGSKCLAMAFGDYRDYQLRLDDVVPGEWSVTFKPWSENKIICELIVCGVTRSSTGEYTPGERGAVSEGPNAEAQAFKRACVMFGLGRDLYNCPSIWVPMDDKKKITPEGKKQLDTHYTRWYKQRMGENAKLSYAPPPPEPEEDPAESAPVTPQAAPKPAAAPAPKQAAPSAPAPKPAPTAAPASGGEVWQSWKSKIDMINYAEKVKGLSNADANGLFTAAIKEHGGYAPGTAKAPDFHKAFFAKLNS